MWAAARSPITSGYRRIGQIYAVPYGSTLGLRLRRGAHMSQKRKHTSFVIFCAGTAPGDAGLALAYSCGGWIVHQLESLILAQNERWRHA